MGHRNNSEIQDNSTLQSQRKHLKVRDRRCADQKLVEAREYVHSARATWGKARVMGSRLLARVNVQEAIRHGLEQHTDSSLPDRPKILRRLIDLADDAKKDKQYGSSVNAVREFGKISGMYEEHDSPDGYIKILQTLVNVNNMQVNISQQPEKEDQ